MLVSEYIRKLQSYEEYAFSWEEVIKACNTPESTIRKELTRLTKRNEILNLRKGFYVIIPAKYQNLGKVPVQLYIEKLFKGLDKHYYLGLFTASAFHGASHQQVQQEYIFTNPPALRDISKGANQLQFIISTNWPQKNIIQKKSDAGYFNISSPALTIVDLIHNQNKIGGLNRVLANIEELIEELTLQDLENLLEWYPHTSTLQRTGYILNELELDTTFLDKIFYHLQQEPFFPILLNHNKIEKAGSVNNRWKIDVNLTLETDL